MTVSLVVFILQAAEVAIRQAKERGEKNLILYTDSQFLINGRY